MYETPDDTHTNWHDGQMSEAELPEPLDAWSLADFSDIICLGRTS